MTLLSIRIDKDRYSTLEESLNGANTGIRKNVQQLKSQLRHGALLIFFSLVHTAENLIMSKVKLCETWPLMLVSK